MSIFTPGKYEADNFRKLPARAQEIWFQFCDISIKKNKVGNLAFLNIWNWEEIVTECKSPIEMIFFFAIELIRCDKNIDFCLIPQYEIITEKGNKKYIADFVYVAEECDLIFTGKNYKLVVECDGHDFHEKTKEQVAYNNERDYALKSEGWDILRFSGSQIYNNPFRCASQTLKYISERIGENFNGELYQTTQKNAPVGVV